VDSLWPYGISWIYLYGVGGLIYAGGTWLCVHENALDLSEPRERRTYILATTGLCIFALDHALFQYVLPFAGT